MNFVATKGSRQLSGYHVLCSVQVVKPGEVAHKESRGQSCRPPKPHVAWVEGRMGVVGVRVFWYHIPDEC